MKLLVTGGSGMVGKALQNINCDAIYLSSNDCDLKNLNETCDIMADYKPSHVLHLAARVGGVKANADYLGDFYFDNILINTNTLEACKRNNVKKVLSMLSTCIFPDATKYPLTEEQMHSGPPHPSNFAYAYVKRMLDVQSRAYREQYGCNFITAIPNNLYGEHDNFNLEQSHVIPAIIRKVYEAKELNKEIVLWGDGSPLREFTYSQDLAKALIFLMEKYNGKDPINIGSSEEVSIKNVAEIIAEELDFKGEVIWDTTKPAGQFKKPSDKSKINSLGWSQERYIRIKDGIKNTCRWFIENYPNIRGVK